MVIRTDNEGLRIELHGREQVWALRAKVDVARSTIKDIRYEPQFRSWRKWEVRMPGTHAPKLLLAGSYWTEEGWDFLYVKRPIGFINPRVENVLVIETDQNRYCRVIVSLDGEEAERIIKWWNKKPSQKSAKKPAKTIKPKSK